MWKLKKQSSLAIAVGFLLLLSGCAINKTITLYPITNKDFCVKGEADCDLSQMDVGMSNFYLNEVLNAKIGK